MFHEWMSKKFLKSLEGIDHGSLTLTLPDGKTCLFSGIHPGPSADLLIHDTKVISMIVFRGDTGFAQAYQDGLCDTNDLSALIELALLNDHALKEYIFGTSLSQWMEKISYLLKLNTLTGSRKNIQAHYDLGNEFYKLWLDPTMTYSCALYGGTNDNLTQAQHNKYDRIIDRLNASSGRVLEIGCGWGGFAERATERGDFSVKGITLSDEQHEFAAHRLAGKADIALEDYRHQSGQFDNIVSIEMFEAVGEKFWPSYFGKIAGVMKQGGRAMIQTITIDDKHFDRYRKGSDMIRSYIFPGGMLPGPSAFKQQAEKAGLRVNDEFHFGADYARTMKEWLDKFEGQHKSVLALGFDEPFIRMWRFYLAACIAGFKTGRTSVMQVELQHA